MNDMIPKSSAINNWFSTYSCFDRIIIFIYFHKHSTTVIVNIKQTRSYLIWMIGSATCISCEHLNYDEFWTLNININKHEHLLHAQHINLLWKHEAIFFFGKGIKTQCHRIINQKALSDLGVHISSHASLQQIWSVRSAEEHRRSKMKKKKQISFYL